MSSELFFCYLEPFIHAYPYSTWTRRRPDDPKINYPAFIGQALMDPEYDWQYETTEQADSNGRKWAHPRGRILGGSSALNFLVSQRGHAKEFDAWAKLGNDGWSWKDLLPFFKRSMTLLPPSSQLQKDNLANYDKEMHGSDGPIQVSFSAWYTGVQKHFMEALKSLGLNSNVDGLRGENTGVWASPATLDQKTWRRSYSASAHYEPNRERDNLTVLCGAQATRVELDNGRATGVHFVHGGQTYQVSARKEVVLSGGSINSPQLLELSGIGSPDVLKAAGVEVKVPLEAVGANLQEHIYCTSSYELKDDQGFETWDKLRNSPDFAAQSMTQYQSQDVDRGIIASAFSGFAYLPLSTYMTKSEIEQVKDEVEGLIKQGHKYYKNDLEIETAQMSLDQIQEAGPPAMEYIFAPGFFATASAPKDGKSYFSILSALQHPFARGTIHITSNDPLAKAAMDPRYFSVKSDLRVLAKAVKWCDEIVKSPSLANAIVQRQDPAPEKYKTEADYEEFVKDFSVTEYHSCGELVFGNWNWI